MPDLIAAEMEDIPRYTYVSIRMRDNDDGGVSGFTDLSFDNALRVWHTLDEYEPIATPDLTVWIDERHAFNLAQQAHCAMRYWTSGHIRAEGDRCFLVQRWRSILALFCKSWNDDDND